MKKLLIANAVLFGITLILIVNIPLAGILGMAAIGIIHVTLALLFWGDSKLIRKRTRKNLINYSIMVPVWLVIFFQFADKMSIIYFGHFNYSYWISMSIGGYFLYILHCMTKNEKMI